MHGMKPFGAAPGGEVVKSRCGGFTLVEIMIVVLIMAILLGIALPNFLHAREVGRARSCQSTLRQIASAKEQWAMDNRKNADSEPTAADLVDSYIKSDTPGVLPSCPLSGTYSIGNLATLPTCSIGANADPASWDDHVILW